MAWTVTNSTPSRLVFTRPLSSLEACFFYDGKLNGVRADLVEKYLVVGRVSIPLRERLKDMSCLEANLPSPWRDRQGTRVGNSQRALRGFRARSQDRSPGRYHAWPGTVGGRGAFHYGPVDLRS